VRRQSRKVPKAATHSLSTAIQGSAVENGSTYAGTLKSENTADCELARNGRPPTMYGFQSGMCGSESAASRRNGWSCWGASFKSVFVGLTSSAGFSLSQGGLNQSVSELDSVLPGSSAGPMKSTARTR
jgi:hypothetical protein